jgi:hypothetical protein
MNQKQLEGAVRRMSADPNLEPQRKAYLMHHIMASRYIVAQQKRKEGTLLVEVQDAPSQGTYHDRCGRVCVRRSVGRCLRRSVERALLSISLAVCLSGHPVLPACTPGRLALSSFMT